MQSCIYFCRLLTSIFGEKRNSLSKIQMVKYPDQLKWCDIKNTWQSLSSYFPNYVFQQFYLYYPYYMRCNVLVDIFIPRVVFICFVREWWCRESSVGFQIYPGWGIDYMKWHKYALSNVMCVICGNGWGLFYWHGLTLIPAWISNHMTNKGGWNYLSIPNFNGCTVEVWEWISYPIPHFIMDEITSPCWDKS